MRMHDQSRDCIRRVRSLKIVCMCAHARIILLLSCVNPEVNCSALIGGLPVD